ncbi:DNA-binding protein [Chryseobacterium joostei]|uniref:DNA binding domain-containing protein, excisionase family n=1 Tax=Chryseobacterium joostei TaxID=112234 RepID=A0A1N7IGW3_9FLAO|nr:helix-turn-helix domain-containing protein [Chryseobacterium joostei]AZB00151.1 DNA-binding protein [Chryseobacterium joostei]SIS36282.1 DNA binding domain-containing protein, excisionase family [Chryseobacterium joostei]
MNLNKNKNSHIEMLLLAVLQELKEQLYYEMEETLIGKISHLTTKINGIEERKPEDLLPIKDAAEFLGVSKVTLWRLRKSGEIKSFMLGSQIYFKKSEILKSLIPVN